MKNPSELTVPRLAEQFLPPWAEDVLRERLASCQSQDHVECEGCGESRGLCMYCAAKAIEEVVQILRKH